MHMKNQVKQVVKCKSSIESCAYFYEAKFFGQFYLCPPQKKILSLAPMSVFFLNLAKSGHLKIPKITYFVLK